MPWPGREMLSLLQQTNSAHTGVSSYANTDAAIGDPTTQCSAETTSPSPASNMIGAKNNSRTTARY